MFPLFDRVLVQRFKPDTVSSAFSLFRRVSLTSCVLQKTASGLFLPTSATSGTLPEATVIAVGPGATNKDGKLIPASVQPGDRVLLPSWGGNSIKVGEEVRSRYLDIHT